MRMRKAKGGALWAALLTAMCAMAAAAVEPEPDPEPETQPVPAGQRLNVLLIAVDDLNTDLGCYGNPVVKSPNIDRLARRAVRFNRAYCQFPLCNPSRTSLLSGRRPETTGVFGNGTSPRKELEKAAFLPEYFRRHGYFTARVGKIAHSPHEKAVKWDVAEDALRRSRDTDAEEREQGEGGGRRKEAKRAKGSLLIEWDATDNPDAEEPDGRTARRVVQLLEEKRDRPFFIAAGFHRPHLPFSAPRKYFDLYPPDRMPLPAAPADDRADIPSVALTHTAIDDEMTDAQKRRAIAAYYACTSFMDAQVGVILDGLKRLKLDGNTVVVFFSDHGFHLGEHGGLWRKMTAFEETARVPLIIAAPGKRMGKVSPRLVELVDLYPTLTELCGLPEAGGMEGLSLVPLLENPDRPWKKAAFTIVTRGKGVFGHSVRTERYRYTMWDDWRGEELYDHKTDPREWTNLINDPMHVEIVAEMRRLLSEGGQGALPSPRGRRLR
jgi:iduronate 2-sulfatase